MFIHLHSLSGAIHSVAKDAIVDIREPDPGLWGKAAGSVIVTTAGQFAVRETVAEAEAIVDAAK